MEHLKIEINEQFARKKNIFDLGDGMSIIITPLELDEHYWIYRVKLFEDQAIIAFPKFSTVAIGFAQEADWNTNLPYRCNAEMIYSHIKHNKKYKEITDGDCLAAIKLIQRTIAAIGEAKEHYEHKDPGY
ncbi:MAG TPA: hypothetical protein VHV10_05190 [Ktedonobacteraceae bacterium]|nr:hypothetical protein [Ktedonobacteraceae bacterium]